ncbi:MAG: putative signal peptide protein, partial [Bacteroidota bacterium]
KHDGIAPILYDVATQLRIETTLLNGKVAIALPPVSGATVRKLVLVNPTTGTNRISALPQTFFEDLRSSNSDYVIISHPKLYDDGQGNNYVQQYADYRDIRNGGAYRTKIIDIQQLYEQFGYGINRHPIAMRNFANFIQKNWRNPAPPKYLFIIGKGREPVAIRAHGILSDPSKQSFLIPTWGTPGSDNLLVGSHQSNSATIAVGRLAATSGKHVQIYLEKIKGLEANVRNLPQTLEARTWMKNILHLSGGSSEAAILKNYLDAMRDNIQVSGAGLNVTSFYRTSTGPLQTSQTKEVFSYINKGLSLITFFGHSAPSTLEYNINEPNQFDNEGKYPSVIALGCASGNIHTDLHNTVSEDMVFYERKGAISLSAASGTAYDGALNSFCERYYKILGANAPLGLGDYIQQTTQQLERFADDALRSVMQEFTLHGDPALRLHRLTAPDYVPDATTVRFQPEVLTTRLDSFNLQLNISNIGNYKRDSMFVLISQTLPSGVVKTVSKVKIVTPPYSQTYTFRLPMLKEALGKNAFSVKVDADNQIAESPAAAESNNELLINNIYISDNSAYIVYPQPFAIVNESDLTLRASTSNAITNNRQYLMELDTTPVFNSALKKKVQINSIGGVLKWAPNLNWQPNTVYYWRVSPDSVDAYGYVWQTASFVYLPQASTGWNQSHYFQYLNNGFDNMNLRSYNRQFQYVNDTKTANVKNRAGAGDNGTNVFFNSIYAGRAYGAGEMIQNIEPTINVYVLDSINLVAWSREDPAHDYGLRHARFNLSLFMFNTSNDDSLTGRTALIRLLNSVPKDNYVILFTIQRGATNRYYPELWGSNNPNGENLVQILENQGATQVRNTVAKPFPYLFAYQKGKGRMAERLADSLNDAIDENFVLTGRWYQGKTLSERIGPAQSWDSVAVQVNASGADKNRFNVYGILPDGVTSRLLVDTNFTTGKSLRAIDANQYPYLKLEWNAWDSIQRTCSQLDYWRVFYKSLPDVGLNASRHYKMSADSIEKGDKVNLQIAVENIGNYNITDSVSFKYVYTDEQNRANVQALKLKPLAKGEYAVAAFTIDARALSQKIKVSMEVNAEQRPKELLYTNNLGQTQFYVIPDRKNPLLEVTFDGQRILNNDIVSAQPTIMIALRDENRFFALADTNLFRLYLKKPGLNEPEKRLFFNLNSELRFIPAGSDLAKNNRAMVEYRPQLGQDGVYNLRIEAKDVANNAAGTSDYQIGFKVITKSSLSNVLNYPNPFSTSTQFVYTLTGSEIPASFKIQIMSVSGKIVREITQQELGDLKIGTHRTDFRWDGTDEFGDKLANGVYLYRIVAKKRNGAAYEMYDTGTNDLFKGGLGKLVIVR